MPKCRNCGTAFKRRRIDQHYCGTLCSREADKRELKRARAVYRALYGWRDNRSDPSAADDLRFVCREIRDWIEEDREAGRLPPPRHNHNGDRGHERRKAPKATAKLRLGNEPEEARRHMEQAVMLGEYP